MNHLVNSESPQSVGSGVCGGQRPGIAPGAVQRLPHQGIRARKKPAGAQHLRPQGRPCGGAAVNAEGPRATGAARYLLVTPRPPAGGGQARNDWPSWLPTACSPSVPTCAQPRTPRTPRTHGALSRTVRYYSAPGQPLPTPFRLGPARRNRRGEEVGGQRLRRWTPPAPPGLAPARRHRERSAAGWPSPRGPAATPSARPRGGGRRGYLRPSVARRARARRTAGRPRPRAASRGGRSALPRGQRPSAAAIGPSGCRRDGRASARPGAANHLRAAVIDRRDAQPGLRMKSGPPCSFSSACWWDAGASAEMLAVCPASCRLPAQAWAWGLGFPCKDVSV